MRIMVTGASGLLGFNLAFEASKNHTVTGVVNSHLIQTGMFEVRQADLLAPGAVTALLRETKPDWIVHCAALANLEDCEASPDLAHLINSELPGDLALQASTLGIPMIHISTDAVFDGQKGNYSEEDQTNPMSVYARTKLAGEGNVADVNPQAIIARVNMFGWSLTGKRSLAEFFFYNLQAGKPLKGFTDVFFCPLLVNDLAETLLAMLEKELNGLYHVVSSDCISKYDFGVAIADKFGFDSDLIAPVSLEDGGLKAARSPLLTLKSNKAAQALGSPLPDISSGMNRFSELRQNGYPQKLLDSLISNN